MQLQDVINNLEPWLETYYGKSITKPISFLNGQFAFEQVFIDTIGPTTIENFIIYQKYLSQVGEKVPISSFF